MVSERLMRKGVDAACLDQDEDMKQSPVHVGHSDTGQEDHAAEEETLAPGFEDQALAAEAGAPNLN